jgi:hypothetical protein
VARMKTWSLIVFRRKATGIIGGMPRNGCVFIGVSFEREIRPEIARSSAKPLGF